MPADGDYAARWAEEGVKGWENIYELTARSSYDTLRRWFPRKSDLAYELGCADGVNTVRIVKDFGATVVIDFSKEFLQMTAQRPLTPVPYFTHSSVEDYDPPDAFREVDAVFALNILEHLDDPVVVLHKYSRYLRKGGRILIAVPNARSLHRHLGVEMGLLESVGSLNAQDRLLGHRRVYDMELLDAHIRAAGLKRSDFLGNYVKPLSARQLNDWDPAILKGLEKLGKEFPFMAADLCVAAWPAC